MVGRARRKIFREEEREGGREGGREGERRDATTKIKHDWTMTLCCCRDAAPACSWPG